MAIVIHCDGCGLPVDRAVPPTRKNLTSFSGTDDAFPKRFAAEVTIEITRYDVTASVCERCTRAAVNLTLRGMIHEEPQR